MSSEEEHNTILKEIRQIRIDLTRHVEDDHYFMYRDDIERILDGQTQMLEKMAEQQDIMADILLGEKYTTYDGEVLRQGGIKEIVDSYRSGEGFKFDIAWSKLLALLGTVVTVAGGIIVAIIETGG